MTKRLNLPDDLRDQFQQLLKLAPAELQDDVKIQNKLLVYLKFGGEKLVRHRLEIVNRFYLEEKWKKAQESQAIETEDSEIDASEDLEDDDSSYSESEDLDDDDSDDSLPDL